MQSFQPFHLDAIAISGSCVLRFLSLSFLRADSGKTSAFSITNLFDDGPVLMRDTWLLHCLCNVDKQATA
jgi:hypothetical protein